MSVFYGELLFEGSDAIGQPALWLSNATAAGTTELFELRNISGAYSYGFELSNLTVFNGELLFEGSDAIGQPAVWLSDGQAAGTTELLELRNISGAYSYGFELSNLTVFNGELLFEGSDAIGQPAVWLSDGQAAGTTELLELRNISGAYSYGFELSNLTVFNGELLFEGSDAIGQPALWLSNGAAAGTTEVFELRNISGAYSYGFELSNLTVFNGELLFEGSDAIG